MPRCSAACCCWKAGVYGNAIRVLCPLVLTDAELDEALGVWEDALAHVLA